MSKQPGKPLIDIKARPKDEDSSLPSARAGTIWENQSDRGTYLSLAPEGETDPFAEYPTIRLALLDENGEDVTEEYYLNAYFREKRGATRSKKRRG